MNTQITNIENVDAEPQAESAPFGWTPSEITRVIVTVIVRHGLTGLGKVLIAFDLVTPEIYGKWEIAHAPTILGFGLTIAGYALSFIEKRYARQLQEFALWTHPVLPDGRYAQVRHVARQVKQAKRARLRPVQYVPSVQSIPTAQTIHHPANPQYVYVRQPSKENSE